MVMPSIPDTAGAKEIAAWLRQRVQGVAHHPMLAVEAMPEMWLTIANMLDMFSEPADRMFTLLKPHPNYATGIATWLQKMADDLKAEPTFTIRATPEHWKFLGDKIMGLDVEATARMALLAGAMRKFAPDLADELVGRWMASSAALDDFLAFLRAPDSAS